uniref:Uncharacterized protein n=1 Tax=Romanomermis culicivorax TaxID=13658 RepID=A0A915HGR5_ROMCU
DKADKKKTVVGHLDLLQDFSGSPNLTEIANSFAMNFESPRCYASYCYYCNAYSITYTVSNLGPN